MSETIQQVPKQIQNLFNKGFAAFERGNHDVAIDLLRRCVQFSPGFLRARRFLRAAQVQRLQKAGGMGSVARRLNALKGLPVYLKTLILFKRGKTPEALLSAEKLLTVDPLNFKAVQIFAQVAVAADQLDAALLTAETANEHLPDHPELARLMGGLYERANNFKAAKDCYEKLMTLLPHDKYALKLLKDAMARETMGAGWDGATESDVSARDLVKDQDQTRMLDLKTKAVKSTSDIEELVAEMRANIEAEPRNLNYYRGLARLLLQQQQFDEAIETLQTAQTLHPSDPELDRSLTQARLQAFDYRIAQLRAAGDDPAADDLDLERAQFAFDDLLARVERYPNDLRLRFELGVQYFENDAIDDALQQFQLAQRSPKDRVDALRYLAMCFRSKQQNDMATQQLEQALELLPSMDEQKKEIIYQLGEIAAEAGDAQRADEYFKQIYRVDVGFRDVAQKVEQVYANQRDASAEELSQTSDETD